MVRHLAGLLFFSLLLHSPSVAVLRPVIGWFVVLQPLNGWLRGV